MHKLCLTAALLAMFFLCAASAVTLNRESGVDEFDRHAVAVLVRTEWDFGAVRCGPALRATFPVMNVGDRRLILRQQSSSCDCISGEDPTIILQPGESTELVATLDTRKLQGAIQTELSYTSSAPNLPAFKLKLLATVEQNPHSDQAAQ